MTPLISSILFLPQYLSASAMDIDHGKLRDVVNSGRVHYVDDFIDVKMVTLLREDIAKAAAEGKLQPSGLSNLADSAQRFSNTKDRSVTPVLGATGYSSSPLRIIEARVRRLRKDLARGLNRPSLADDSLAHEIYYSQSTSGSLLPRHLDERHEEIKGRKGWLGRSRRSISWLIYLSDQDWDYRLNGGQLRSYPISLSNTGSSSLAQVHFGGAHERNLQIAWIRLAEGQLHPVYMDSWKRPALASDNVPVCGLYIVEAGGGKTWITRDFEIRDGNTGAFDANVYQRALQPGFSADDFHLIEDIDRWRRGLQPSGSEGVDINPTAGRLVVFDSVSIPHEVVAVEKGRRLALAGWFHESSGLPA